MTSGPKFRKKLRDYPGMVNWYSPGVLVQSGLLSLISGTFGHYADKRVTQYLADNVHDGGGALSREALINRHDYSAEAHDGEAFWVDYIADLGDGFDSTYSMAYLLAQRALYGTAHEAQAPGVAALRNLDTAAELPHGRLLIMGGDQCYPVPGPAGREYVDRMITPYTMALPENNSSTPRDLFAIPGNHDWYDGLLAFDRIFCSTREAEHDMPGQSIGGWQTRQHRSYFALKLPYNWWIWGADIQLSETLDTAQLKYFHTVGRSLTEEDKIIICTAQHSWYAENREDAVSTLEQLEDIMRPALEQGAHLRAVIAGDSHHYSRYFSEETDFHMLTAGGGGAFLHPTHHLRSRVKIGWRGRIHDFTLRNRKRPVADKKAQTEDATAGQETADPQVRETRDAACYPTRRRSRRLILRNFFFPFTSKLFALALGAVYWVMTWFISETNVTDKLGQVLGNAFPSTAEFVQYAALQYLNGDIGIWGMIENAVTGFFAGVVNSPTISAMALLIWFALISFADFKSWIAKTIIGSLHFAAHMLAMMGVYAFVSYFIASEAELNEVAKTYLGETYAVSQSWRWFVEQVPFIGGLWEAGPIIKALAFPFVMVPIGGLIGGFIFGAYLWFCYRWLGAHWNDTFSALAIDDHKNFLRMKFEPTRLTIYPIGLDKVARRRTIWNFWRRVNWRLVRDWDGKGPMVIPSGKLRPHLIEGPIVIGHKLPDSYKRQVGGTPDKYAPGLDFQQESKLDGGGLFRQLARRAGRARAEIAGKVGAAAAAAVAGGARLARAGRQRQPAGGEGHGGKGDKGTSSAGEKAGEKAEGDGAGQARAEERPAPEVPEPPAGPDRQEAAGAPAVAESTAQAEAAAVFGVVPEARDAALPPQTVARGAHSVHDPLSLPRDQMKPHYQVVVIGSGYGGGIAAARLARAGKSVCVLERGREFLPGSFPDRLSAGAREVQISRNGRHVGNEQGLFDIRLHDDLNVVVGCGLGGTSLINANVSIMPDPRLFEDPAWPRALVQDGLLEEGVARARHMLRPVETPEHITPDKFKAFKLAADKLGHPCARAEINVNFAEQVNPAGVKQPACTLCGDCVSGCNVGAKNTVNLTYLPEAKAHGAEIFTECQVRFLRFVDGVWQVVFTTPDERSRKTVTADMVVLAAGTLGSTEILLRSRDQGLPLSPQLGKNLSGNGDVMAFAYNNDVPVHGVGVGHPPRVDTAVVGACIAGLVDLRKDRPLHEGMIIEEGALPSLVGPLLPTLFAGGSLLFGEDSDLSFEDELSEAGRATQSLIKGAYHGAVAHTQTFLVMAHDDGKGEMVLEDDRLKVNWPGVARQEVFQRIDKVLAEMTAATGGTYIKNPMSRTILGENLVTVHPLGGCAMGEDRSQGVVNDRCQVFNGAPDAAPDAVHEGLYVCDGAVIPRPLGVNPLLTISAIAERAMMLLLEDHAEADQMHTASAKGQA